MRPSNIDDQNAHYDTLPAAGPLVAVASTKDLKARLRPDVARRHSLLNLWFWDVLGYGVNPAAGDGFDSGDRGWIEPIEPWSLDERGPRR
ncbi:MAG TPA: hypothetical protein VFE51_19420 [Verrucomicrobiae bacterium]|nr:hypothetical protein [Verrucomicrobiae bacterium]